MNKEIYDDVKNILDTNDQDVDLIRYKDIRPEFMGLSDNAKLYISKTINEIDFLLTRHLDSILWAFYALCIEYMYIDEYKDGSHIVLIKYVGMSEIEELLHAMDIHRSKDQAYLDVRQYMQSRQSFLYDIARNDVLEGLTYTYRDYDMHDKYNAIIPKDIPDILDVYNLFGKIDEIGYWKMLLSDYKPADYPDEYVYI